VGLKNCSLRDSCSRNMGSVMGGGRAEVRWGGGVMERRMAGARGQGSRCGGMCEMQAIVQVSLLQVLQ
jgi:hypothetical protein